MSFGLPYGVKGRDDKGKLRSINTINGERYVYYDRLKDDKINSWAPDLHTKANSVLFWRTSNGSNTKDISGFFRGLAVYEFTKEKALLETHFDTNYDPNSEYCGKALIEAFNEILSTKEIFERNALLIANTNGQKALFSFFPGYLNKVLEKRFSSKEFIETIKQASLQNITDKSKSDKIIEGIQDYIQTNPSEIIEEALELMFSSETKAENGLQKKVGDKEFERLGKAYKEIFKALKRLNGKAQGNEFIKGAIKTYNLDNLGEMITSSLNTEELNIDNLKSLLEGFKFETKIKSDFNTGSLAGVFTEYFGKFLGEVVLSNSGTKFTAHHTGSIGNQKADYMFTIGMSRGAEQAIERKLSNFQGKGRGTNVEDVKKFTEEVFKDFGDDNSFMIFVNAKNWTLNKNFEKGYANGLGGYSAGAAIDLNAWDDMMHQMNIRGRDFIFTILQMIPGAIGNPNGDGKKMEEVSLMFERAIGSALFDDFEPDDPFRNNKKSGLKIVHLLYLNGVYIPLSVFYTLLSEAFGELQNSLERDDLVQVKFTLPEKIKYPKQEDEDEDLAAGKKPWVEQSNEALDKIKVSYSFMRGFKKFMEKYYSLEP